MDDEELNHRLERIETHIRLIEGKLIEQNSQSMYSGEGKRPKTLRMQLDELDEELQFTD